MTLSQRDMFESQYILRHMIDEPYYASKKMLENLRHELTYNDDHISECYYWWVNGVEFDRDD